MHGEAHRARRGGDLRALPRARALLRGGARAGGQPVTRERHASLAAAGVRARLAAADAVRVSRIPENVRGFEKSEMSRLLSNEMPVEL